MVPRPEDRRRIARGCDRLKLLGLDIATTTGFAAADVGGAPIFGHRDFSAPAPGAVFGAYRDWLSRQLDLIRPDWVYAEQPFSGRNAYTVRRLYGLRAHTEEIIHRRDIPLTWVPIKALSEFFIGYGGGRSKDKKTATVRMAQDYGWRVTTDDEADALALVLYGEHQHDPLAARQRSAGVLFARAS